MLPFTILLTHKSKQESKPKPAHFPVFRLIIGGSSRIGLPESTQRYIKPLLFCLVSIIAQQYALICPLQYNRTGADLQEECGKFFRFLRPKTSANKIFTFSPGYAIIIKIMIAGGQSGISRGVEKVKPDPWNLSVKTVVGSNIGKRVFSGACPYGRASFLLFIYVYLRCKSGG